MKTYFLYIILISIIPGQSIVLSQEKQTNIDSLYNICLDQNQTTQGMIQCAQNAQKEWDKEMNKYYNKLMNILKEDEKEALRSSQKKWLAYRDSEFKFSETMYVNFGGTMWLFTSADREASIVKTRALELKGYYTDQTEGK